ncbi:hypothetical protein ACIBCO_35895 [Streptomyces violascens]|uniref:hypothetical protein n=1 Tax=Streptomyces violascens TaxID=67381 RepID=UPI00378DA1F7
MPAATPKDLKTKALLEAAATKLRSINETAMADAIDLVLSPKGKPFVNRIQSLRPEYVGTTNVPIRMPEALRTHLKQAAADAHETLSDDATDALQQFIDGTFTPEKRRRAARSAPGTVAASGNLNVTPPTALIEEASKAAQTRAKKLGWTPRPSNVITAYLIAKYGTPDDTGTE